MQTFAYRAYDQKGKRVKGSVDGDSERLARQRLYRPKGCDACHDTGYIGRFGLFDLLVMDDTLRQMVHKGVTESEMDRYAHRSSPSLRDYGFSRVASGETSVAEALSVTMA